MRAAHARPFNLYFYSEERVEQDILTRPDSCSGCKLFVCNKLVRWKDPGPPRDGTLTGLVSSIMFHLPVAPSPLPTKGEPAISLLHRICMLRMPNFHTQEAATEKQKQSLHLSAASGSLDLSSTTRAHVLTCQKILVQAKFLECSLALSILCSYTKSRPTGDLQICTKVKPFKTRTLHFRS